MSKRDKIPDEEIEMFLSDLNAEDWVFLLRPDGTLKAMIVPKMEVGDIVSENVIKVFDALDPKLFDTIMETTTIIDEELELDQAFEEYKKKPKDTLH